MTLMTDSRTEIETERRFTKLEMMLWGPTGSNGMRGDLRRIDGHLSDISRSLQEIQAFHARLDLIEARMKVLEDAREAGQKRSQGRWDTLFRVLVACLVPITLTTVGTALWTHLANGPP